MWTLFILLNPLYSCFLVSRRLFNKYKLAFILVYSICFALVFTFRKYGITYGIDGFNYDDDSLVIMEVLDEYSRTGDLREQFGFVFNTLAPLSRLFGPFIFPFLIYALSFALIQLPACLSPNAVSSPPLLSLTIFIPVAGSFFNLYSTFRQYCIFSMISFVLSSRYIIVHCYPKRSRVAQLVNVFCIILVFLSFGIHILLAPLLLVIFVLTLAERTTPFLPSPLFWLYKQIAIVTKTLKISLPTLYRFKPTLRFIIPLFCLSGIGYAFFSFAAKYHTLLSLVPETSSLFVYPQLIIATLLLYAFYLKYDRACLAQATTDCLLFFMFLFTVVNILLPSFSPVLSLIYRFLVYSPWITIPIFAFTNLSFFNARPPAYIVPANALFNLVCFSAFLLFLTNYYLDPIAFHPYSHLNNIINGYLPSPLSPVFNLVLNHNSF
jgi:hypothetical protein